MKTFALAGAALLALTATVSAAQVVPGRSAQPLTRAHLQARVDAGFARVDVNRDGFVTQDEAQAGRQGRGMRQDRRGARMGQRAGGRVQAFARLDLNHDGVLNQAEFENRQRLGGGDRGERRALRGQRRGGGGGGMFARFGGRAFGAADANHDGRVSRDEAQRGALTLFARVDTNRDGAISIEERQAARQFMRGQRQNRRQG